MPVIQSPIEIAVNTNRVFMEGLHCLLDLRLVNRSADEEFQTDIRLKGRVLPAGVARSVLLPPDATRLRSIELQLPLPEPGKPGCAGYARFEIDLEVRSQEEGAHRFAGEFTLSILAHATNRSQVNINIEKVIEQHDKGGMGAINEIDLSNLVKLPAAIDTNELIRQERPPRYVDISLDYLGSVTPKVLPRETPPMERCALDFGDHRLLVVTGDTLVFGRNRQNTDIVTWVMPRSEENDLASREISGRHCRLALGEESLRIRHLSHANPTRLDQEAVSGHPPIPLDRESELRLHHGLALTLRPLPAGPTRLGDWSPDPDAATRRLWNWSARTNIGGLLITRDDSLAGSERYLWLISSVSLALFGEATLLALPDTLAACGAKIADLGAPAARAVPLCEGDGCTAGKTRWTVHPFEQALEE